MNTIFDEIGNAVEWTKPYEIPYFFESRHRRMMREPGDDTVSFKTFNGEYFQFYMDRFHGHPCLILTSTLLDCAFFVVPSLEESKRRAKKASEYKCAIKGSYSGYASYGKKMLEQYFTLEEHMKQEGIWFSDKVLVEIKKILTRRAKS